MRKIMGSNAMLYVNGMAFITFMCLYFAIGDPTSDTWNGLYFAFQYMMPLALIARLKTFEKSYIFNILNSMYFALLLYVIMVYGFDYSHSDFIIFVYFIFSLFLLSHERLIKFIWGQ